MGSSLLVGSTYVVDYTGYYRIYLTSIRIIISTVYVNTSPRMFSKYRQNKPHMNSISSTAYDKQ